MVTNQENILGLLRVLENELPLTDQYGGPVLTGFNQNVQPVLNLADYDPDAPATKSSAFGTYGTLIAIEAGAKELTSAGAQTHTYLIESGGIPAGEIQIIRNLTIDCDAAAAEDWKCSTSGFGIALYSGIYALVRTQTNEAVNLTSRSDSITTPTALGVQTDRPIILYPGQVLSIQSQSTIADGAKSKLTMLRERYTTSLVVADKSADIDASAI